MTNAPSAISPRLAQVAIAHVAEAVAILVPSANGVAFEFVNPAFESMFGYTAEEAHGQPGSILSPRPSVDGFLRLEFDRTHPHRGEALLRKKDGTDLLVQVNLRMVDLDGAMAGLLVMRDVTEYRRLEHIAGALESSESVGYVFAGLRHELGNPLNSLKAALALLSDTSIELPASRRQDYLLRSIAEIRRMETLLEQMRTFNMNESVACTTVEVRPFLERFLRIARPDCEARDIDLRLLDGPSASIVADPRLLHQILILLLSNACEAAVPERKQRIDLSCHCTSRVCRISVSDTGSGMTESQLMNAQRPFVTSKPKGTGLGLPLARKYAAFTRCTLGITSALGVGTTCTLEFELINEGAS